MVVKPDPAAAIANTIGPPPKKPQSLTKYESVGAVVLFIAGLALIGLTLYGFSNTDSNFIFKSKEVTKTEPVQQSSSGGQAEESKPQNGGQIGTTTTEEVEYADTVVIFALTAGAALALGGAFYGRLRSLKLGGLELGIVGSEEEQKAADKAAETVQDSTKVSDDHKEIVTKAAQEVAKADLRVAAAMGIKPTDSLIDGIGSQAAKKVTDVL